LSRLAALEPNESNINHVNAIRGMALACRLPLQEFLSKIEQYEKTLGPWARNSFSSASRKAKWAVFVSDEVKKIRAIVAAKTISINLLLAAHTSESVSTLESRGSTRHSELLGNIAEHSARLRSLSNAIGEVKEGVTLSQQALSGELGGIKTQLRTEFLHYHSQLLGEVSKAQQSLLDLQYLGAQNLELFRTFPEEVRCLLQTANRANMEMYNVLLAIQGQVAPSPSLLSSSNIEFEDGLGIIRHLPYEWFKHWEVSCPPFRFLLIAED
jgi:hypothetical protein